MLLLCYLMLMSQFYVNNGNCVYNKAGYIVKCYSINSYSNISREISTLYLENSCNLNIFECKNFIKTFKKLEKISFDPYCPNYLLINSDFSHLKIQGRCLIKETKPEINIIIDEIAKTIALLTV